MSIIVVIIDNEDAAAENDGVELTPEALGEYAQNVGNDASGIYGFRGVNSAYNVSDGLLRLLADAARGER